MFLGPMAAAFFLLAFLLLAHIVGTGETQAIDRAILLGFRHVDDPTSPLGPDWLRIALLDLTALGSIAVLCLLVVLAFGYLLLRRRPLAALMVAAGLGVGLTAMSLLKQAFERPRPDLAPHLTQVYTSSFPSGHAMLSAIVYLTLGALIAQSERSRAAAVYVMGLAIFLTLLVGVSRVYLAVHWPSDILAGWLLGAGWAILCALLLTSLKRR